MNRQNSIAITFLTVVFITLTACAQSKKSMAGNSRKNVTQNDSPLLLQATEQTTMPGRPEIEPTTDNRFVIVWKSKETPASFFWRGNQSWMPCNVSKVNSYKPLVVKKSNNGIPVGLNYTTIKTGNLDFKTGDTLELYPVAGGKHPIPAEVPADKNNIIYYKTVNSNWLALPVDSITVLPPIVMP